MKKELKEILSSSCKFLIAYVVLILGCVPVFFGTIFIVARKESIINFMTNIPSNRYWIVGIIFIVSGFFTALPLMVKYFRNYNKIEKENDNKRKT